MRVEALTDAKAMRRLVRFVVALAMVWSLLVAIAVVWWGGEELAARVRSVGLALAVATLAAFGLSHLLRFTRWHLMLRAEGHAVPWWRGFSIFMAGLALLPTPAKAGVAARSLLLLREGVPVHVSLAAYFVERLLDLVGLLVLASLVVWTGAPQFRVLLALGIALAAMLAVALAPAVCAALRTRLAARAAIVRALDWLLKFFTDAGHMITGWRLPLFVALGMAANATIGVLLWYALLGTASPIEFAAAPGIVGLAHLSGSASLLPGGIGGFELSMLAQLSAFGVAAADALIALMLVRVTTLWGSVIVGLPLLYAGLRRSAGD